MNDTAEFRYQECRRQILQEYSILVVFDGLPAWKRVPSKLEDEARETFAQWKKRVLGQDVTNVRVFLAVEPAGQSLVRNIAPVQSLDFSELFGLEFQGEPLQRSRQSLGGSISDLIPKTDHEIKEIVAHLGRQRLTESSHLHKKYPNLDIASAARKSAQSFRQHQNASIGLMEVVLSANRDYVRQVEENIKRLRNEFADLTLKQLQDNLRKTTWQDFKEVWGHRDEKKFNTLKNLVDAFLSMPCEPCMKDFERIRGWANRVSLSNLDNDPIAKIPNVGLATLQHLRLTFGVDTVKPDRRVKEVLANEFEMKRFGDQEAILAVEYIAGIVCEPVAVIDSIFVNYGSGYYRQNGGHDHRTV